MELIAFLFGLALYFFLRVLASGFYTVRPDERAVITSFGRAERIAVQNVDPNLSDAERERYPYPRVRVVQPGGPYLKLPWQKVHKVSVATQAVDVVWDPTKEQTTIEAVTKDNLTTGVNGQIRYRVSENNLYAYLFGVSSPLEHVMGFFISVLRERIANFVDPKGASLITEGFESPPPLSAEDTVPGGPRAPGGRLGGTGDPDAVGGVGGPGEAARRPGIELSEGVSINDLRKNLPLLNQYMEEQCKATQGRYGIELDAALITEIDPPLEVDRALSAINSTRNQVAADISTARADAEQQITMSERAVEIAQNNAEAEVAPLRVLAEALTGIKREAGQDALVAYVRNQRVPLLTRARRIVMQAK
ncbi:MAG: SPFH domain-containing protein [Candidatus Eisenbacteria bacterium]|nr:SPFH domain-containing protein [Candidatus Eisenbacteria bacterium]